QCAEQRLVAFAGAGHAAAGPVHDWHDAIDVRKLIQEARARSRFGDMACNCARTVHRGQDADIVPRPHAPVRTVITLKAPAILDWGQRRVRASDGVILTMLTHAQIVDMDMI